MAGVGPLLPDDPVRLGRYELAGRLGEGGQGVVYLGRRDDGVRAAVKVLRAPFARDPEGRARFERELPTIGRVAGFCTAPVVDADISGDLPYIAVEYVPGPSLSGLVGERGPRAGADLDRLAIGTVTALAAIHRAGIAHGGFKPSNVLMGPEGPRVVDFGIARTLGSSSAGGGGSGGTPYMAPEQFTGGEPGAGADMFAWAATTLFAATGRHPFGDDAASAVLRRVPQDEPGLSVLPEPLRDAVASCLAEDPAARPEAQEVLRSLLGGSPEAQGDAAQGDEAQGDEETFSAGADFARTPPAGGRAATDPGGTAPPRRRRRALVIAAAVAVPLLVFTAAGTAWALRPGGSAKAPAPAASESEAENGPAEPPAAAAAALRPAERAIETVLTFDHTSPNEGRASARRVSTPRFMEDVDGVVSDRYIQEMKERKGSLSTEAVDSAVVAASSDKVRVLVYAKRTFRAENAEPSRLQDPLRLTMVRQGGRWLLDEIDILNALSGKMETDGAAWPGPRARGAMDAAERHPPVASGTPLETGLRPAGRPDRLLALVAVGDCESECVHGDRVTVRRLLLQRSGDGWGVVSSKRL
ncbi:protein kinase domain-containing protein [Actinomadura welshii]